MKSQSTCLVVLCDVGEATQLGLIVELARLDAQKFLDGTSAVDWGLASVLHAVFAERLEPLQLSRSICHSHVLINTRTVRSGRNQSIFIAKVLGMFSETCVSYESPCCVAFPCRYSAN